MIDLPDEEIEKSKVDVGEPPVEQISQLQQPGLDLGQNLPLASVQVDRQEDSEISPPPEMPEVSTSRATSNVLILVKNKLVEKSPELVLVPRNKLRSGTRRDFLIYGAGVASMAAGFWWLLPDEVKNGLGFKSETGKFKTNFLQNINTFDDTVAKTLFSPNNMVPTYSKSEMTELPNNYAGATPDAGYIDTWKLKISGLASGKDIYLSADHLRNNFQHHEIISRLVCVEGWSAISWWGGLRFSDLLKKYPPRADTKWIQLTSDVNLDGDGNSDPYFVSLDLASALHPQTLLTTHHNGKLLELEHGAPLRLLAPMKLGLKNIKAITSIAYSNAEPGDYWNKQGYSYYDGI